ncbi:AI-2E family transporter [Ornithinicoccus halotolerans]|uniref:AI-2E family transporter n=1 Tax=Ornithinicoccus halotolerans TaxID=1748220 RepID=UPI001E457C81|nr:AI-2E family transporter [Ornithinicoccus halotolerans]
MAARRRRRTEAVADHIRDHQAQAGRTAEGTAPAPVDRGQVIAEGMRVAARWSGRFLLIVLALAVFLWLLGRAWVGVFPVIMAIIVCTVLWPPVAWMRARRAPPALAAIGTILLAFAVFIGLLASVAPSVVRQSREIVTQATEGVEQVRQWLAGPPVNLDNERLNQAIDQGSEWVQQRSSEIASGVFTGVTAVGSGLVTLALVLVLTFFFLKDGPQFLPWLRRVAGHRAGDHLTEILTRVWHTLSGFIRAQAMVSGVDAFFIGLGLLILGVPLAIPLAIITFIAGFIPIVGAVTAGALAVLVALVSNSFTTALIVLAIVIGVQQLEGNVLQPFLQGRSMHLHAGIVLLSVAGGATLFGIVGAFLAVPLAASVVVVLRYISEQIDVQAGLATAGSVSSATPEGTHATVLAEEASTRRRVQPPQNRPGSRGRDRNRSRTGWRRFLPG